MPKQDAPVDLFFAVQEDLVGAIPSLLARGANPEARDGLGRTPLMRACEAGRDRCAKALLAQANPDAICSTDGSTALMWAVHGGHWRCVAELSSRADAKIRSFLGLTPLMLAAKRGDLECAAILAPISEVRAKSARGQDAAAMARSNGRPEVAELIEGMLGSMSERARIDEAILVKAPGQARPAKIRI